MKKKGKKDGAKKRGRRGKWESFLHRVQWSLGALPLAWRPCCQ